MRRREIVLAPGVLVLQLGFSCVGMAQNTRPRCIGILAPGPLRPIESFKNRLREHGWIDGDNIRFESRWAQDDETRYPVLAAELAALPADIILTWSSPAVLAAKRATTTIPIVMAAIADPVGVGAVSSLARPGGNVTGFSTQNYELEAKRFELLREVVPDLKRVAILANTSNPYAMSALKQVTAIAETGGVRADSFALDLPAQMESGLARLLQTHPDGVLVLAAPAFFPHSRMLVDFMAANHLPAVYPYPEFTDAGGLISYSSNFDDLFREAADYVDRILHGAFPADLPVQQAATFRLVVNQRAAVAIGLEIPRSVLIQADEVID